MVKMREPEEGFEPTTYCLQNSCSAPELLRRICAGRGIRTPVGTRPSDLQSDAIDHSAIPAHYLIYYHTYRTLSTRKIPLPSPIPLPALNTARGKETHLKQTPPQ